MSRIPPLNTNYVYVHVKSVYVTNSITSINGVAIVFTKTVSSYHELCVCICQLYICHELYHLTRTCICSCQLCICHELYHLHQWCGYGCHVDGKLMSRTVYMYVLTLRSGPCTQTYQYINIIYMYMGMYMYIFISRTQYMYVSTRVRALAHKYINI